ncbi:MAG: TrkH family potassium uptake protein, partial [Sutterella wadsworthensis]|nr:TrkH family potassium uptake protein [Sutterella wadsworthensis]
MFNTIRYLLLPVLNASGPVFIWLAAALLIPFTLSVSKQDGAADSFLTCFLITLATGVVLMLLTRRWRRELTSRHGFLLVTLIWTSVPLFGTIPFIIERPDMSFAQLYFEMMSCLTTTGATVFTGLDKLPVSLNGWRCFLSWIGGMGLIVLSVAILPLLGVGGSQIIKAETTGPLKEHRLTPRIADTAKALYIIYLGVSVACAISYHLAGMEWEDAIMHMMTTVSLSGIATHDASFAYFNSPAVDAVAIVFMLISGFNFSLHFMAWRRRNFLIYLQDAEAKAWIATAALMSALTIIVLADAHVYETSAETVRHALFSVVSVITTTGYATVDYASWPLGLPVLLLVAAAFS